MKSMVVPTQNS